MGIFLITQLSSCQKKMENFKTEKIEWEGQSTAPEDYAVVIMSPNVFYSNNGKYISLIPNLEYLHSGWSGAAGGWESAPKPMPDHLSIAWYSHTENKIYKGEFEMPQEKLYNLFKEGYMIYGQRPDGTDGKEDLHKETYNSLTVGIAPKGMVVVWAAGQNRIEIGRYQAEKLSRKEANELYNSQSSGIDMPKTIVKAQLDRMTPKVQEEIKHNKISSKQWDDYRLRYHWKVEFNKQLVIYDYYIRYFNSEEDGYLKPEITQEEFNKNILESTSKVVPNKFGMYVTAQNGKNYLIRLETLDEQETIEGFKSMNEASPDQPITMFINVDDDFKKFTVTLKNDKKEILLQKATLKLFTLDKTNDRKNEK